ncbi:Uncharacterised protein (plasmid) [Mycoplasmopsis fermentans]|nr:Uncharacterised protein [Mycoplasmopsis fermentans]
MKSMPTLQTEKYNEVEKMIHKSIDRISKLRINKNREFFNIPPEKAYDILLDIKELLGNEAKLELMGDNVEVHTKEKTKRGEPFDFYSRGLKRWRCCFIHRKFKHKSNCWIK